MSDEYDELVQQAKNRTHTASKDYIPKCCEILKAEGKSNEDLVHKIRKDFSFWSPTTIYEAIPDEYKKETKPKKELEESIQPPESILIEKTTNGKEEYLSDDEYGKGVVPVIDEPNNNQYDKELTERYEAHLKEFDELVDKFNGLQTHNEYLEEMNKELKQAVDALQAARVPASTTQSDMKQHTPSHRGYWIRFDTTNIELTRPLINIINRARDRPKQFFIEVMDDEVIEISENRPAQ